MIVFGSNKGQIAPFPEEDDVSTVSCPKVGNETERKDFPVIPWCGSGMGPGPRAEEGLEILIGSLSCHLSPSPIHRSLRGNRVMESDIGQGPREYPHGEVDESDSCGHLVSQSLVNGSIKCRIPALKSAMDIWGGSSQWS